MKRPLLKTDNPKNRLIKSLAWALLIIASSSHNSAAQSDERLQALAASFIGQPVYFRGDIESPITQSKSYVIKSDYILPNEFNDQIYQPCLEDMTGAFISVGSFRSFTRAAYGDFSDLIVLDYNIGVTAFNRILTRLLTLSEDTRKLMSLLMLGKASAVNLGEPAMNACDQVKVLRRESRADGFKAVANWQVLLGDDHQLETEILEELKVQRLIFHRSGYDDDMGTMICESYNSHRARFMETIIGSDALFSKIRKLAQKDRITSINGDVTDPQSFRDLASQLNAKGVVVSAFDISNIPDYLSRDQLIAVIDNLQTLPWGEDGKVLFTSAFNHLNNVPGDSFGYFYINFEDLDLVREAKITKKFKDDNSYLNSASVKSVNLAHQTCTGKKIQKN